MQGGQLLADSDSDTSIGSISTPTHLRSRSSTASDSGPQEGIPRSSSPYEEFEPLRESKWIFEIRLGSDVHFFFGREREALGQKGSRKGKLVANHPGWRPWDRNEALCEGVEERELLYLQRALGSGSLHKPEGVNLRYAELVRNFRIKAAEDIIRGFYYVEDQIPPDGIQDTYFKGAGPFVQLGPPTLGQKEELAGRNELTEVGNSRAVKCWEEAIKENIRFAESQKREALLGEELLWEDDCRRRDLSFEFTNRAKRFCEFLKWICGDRKVAAERADRREARGAQLGPAEERYYPGARLLNYPVFFQRLLVHSPRDAWQPEPANQLIWELLIVFGGNGGDADEEERELGRFENWLVSTVEKAERDAKDEGREAFEKRLKARNERPTTREQFLRATGRDEVRRLLSEATPCRKRLWKSEASEGLGSQFGPLRDEIRDWVTEEDDARLEGAVDLEGQELSKGDKIRLLTGEWDGETEDGGYISTEEEDSLNVTADEPCSSKKFNKFEARWYAKRVKLGTEQGSTLSTLEKDLRRVFPHTDQGERSVSLHIRGLLSQVRELRDRWDLADFRESSRGSEAWRTLVSDVKTFEGHLWRKTQQNPWEHHNRPIKAWGRLQSFLESINPRVGSLPGEAEFPIDPRAIWALDTLKKVSLEAHDVIEEIIRWHHARSPNLGDWVDESSGLLEWDEGPYVPEVFGGYDGLQDGDSGEE